jgi:Flp pilus assembly protein TadB
MLASTRPIAVLTVIVTYGTLIVIAITFLTARRLRRSHPLPQELKVASRRDRRKLAHWAPGEDIDVNPDLARAYVRFVSSSAPLRRRSDRLYFVVGALVVLLALLVNPLANPIMWPVIVLLPLVFVWHYRDYKRLERFISYRKEANRGSSS